MCFPCKGQNLASETWMRPYLGLEKVRDAGEMEQKETPDQTEMRHVEEADTPAGYQ